MSDAVVAVCVVVPVKDDADNLRRCLTALSRCRPAAAQLVVVDDGSTRDEQAVAQLAGEFGATLLRNDRALGPAHARNRGATLATQPAVLFIDADCEAHVDTVALAASNLAEGSGYDAVFGSYDDAPAHPAFVSAWKNLAHHHTHHEAAHHTGDAASFWSGCGAMRTEVFRAFHGFDAEQFGRPCIEDVELGMRLALHGHRIRLDPRMQVKHRKRWTWGKLLRTDLLDRAVPWVQTTKRLAARATAEGRPMPKVGLNTGPSQKLAALLAAGSLVWLLIAGVVGAIVDHPRVLGVWIAPLAGVALTLLYDRLTATRLDSPPVRVAVLIAWLAALAITIYLGRWWSLPAVVGLVGVVLINARFYAKLAGLRGVAFATLSVVPHVAYYLTALLGFAIGTLR